MMTHGQSEFLASGTPQHGMAFTAGLEHTALILIVLVIFAVAGMLFVAFCKKDQKNAEAHKKMTNCEENNFIACMLVAAVYSIYAGFSCNNISDLKNLVHWDTFVGNLILYVIVGCAYIGYYYAYVLTPEDKARFWGAFCGAKQSDEPNPPLESTEQNQKDTGCFKWTIFWGSFVWLVALPVAMNSMDESQVFEAIGDIITHLH